MMHVYLSGALIATRYEIVEGPREKPSLAGGMGLVYLCVDRAEAGRPMALKTFKPAYLADRTARERFLREGKTWVDLGRHPHIVRAHRVERLHDGAEVYLVLELVAAAEGKRDASLRAWLMSREPLALVQALRFALDIARGMSYATTRLPGLVHRDLKPENILVGRDGKARVTDFGLVKALAEGKIEVSADPQSGPPDLGKVQFTRGVGTPLYMAPEQWTGEPLDLRADIYAFGCILYELLTGRYAAEGKNLHELQRSHQTERNLGAALPPDCPDVVRTLVERCTLVNAATRPRSWDEVSAAVASGLHTVTGQPVPETETLDEESRAERLALTWSYNEIGAAYLDIGKFAVAQGYFQQVLERARTEQDRSFEATALGNLGNAHYLLGEPRQAIECLEPSLALAQAIGERPGEANALGNLANAYAALGQADRALDLGEQALRIKRELGDRRGISQALSMMGNAYRDLGELERAMDCFVESLAIVRRLGDRQAEGTDLGNLGSTYYQAGELQRAVEALEQSLAIARETGDRRGEGIGLGNLANVQADLGDLPRSLALSTRQLEIAREIGDRFSEARALGNLALSHRDLGEPERAVAYGTEAVALFQAIGDRRGEGDGLANLGLAYAALGEHRLAIQCNEVWLAIARELGNRNDECEALGRLGNLHAVSGQLGRAMAYHEQQYKLARAIGSRVHEAQALGMLGSSLGDLGEYERSMAYLEQAIAIEREVGNFSHVATFSFHLARLMVQQARLSAALPYAELALWGFTQTGQQDYAALAEQLVAQLRSSAPKEE